MTLGKACKPIIPYLVQQAARKLFHRPHNKLVKTRMRCVLQTLLPPTIIYTSNMHGSHWNSEALQYSIVWTKTKPVRGKLQTSRCQKRWLEVSRINLQNQKIVIKTGAGYRMGTSSFDVRKTTNVYVKKIIHFICSLQMDRHEFVEITLKAPTTPNWTLRKPVPIKLYDPVIQFQCREVHSTWNCKTKKLGHGATL